MDETNWCTETQGGWRPSLRPHTVISLCLYLHRLCSGHQLFGIGAHPYDFIFLNYLIKGPISKYGHVLGMEVGGVGWGGEG